MNALNKFAVPVMLILTLVVGSAFLLAKTMPEEIELDMDANAVGIPIMFIVIGAIMLWFLLSGKGWWWAKAILVAGCCFFVFLLWHSVSWISGWPCERQLPEKFQIHWLVVKEGSKKGNDDGGIYIWVTELNNDYLEKETKKQEWWNLKFVPTKRKGTPVAHKIPYSKELHKQALKVLKGIRSGRSMVGQRGKGDNKGFGKGEKGEMKGKGKGWYRYGKNKNKIMFYQMPNPKMPPKIHP